MSKSNQVRSILRRCEPVFTDEVAHEVGCTQPLVFQIIRRMREEGEIFEERQVGRRVSYRLLSPEEAEQYRARRRKLEEESRRQREFQKISEHLMAAQSALEDARLRLAALAP